MNFTIRQFGLIDYSAVYSRMQAFTAARNAQSADEIWLLEHPPVFTLGLGARAEHVLEPGAIPVVQTDRGGQVTYHGPGQLIAYLLLDLRRRGYGVRSLVRRIELGLIDYLVGLGLPGERRDGAPGIYISQAKIAALGLRVKNGCSYHGLALNVNLDLEPFKHIDPCGYPGLQVTRLCDLGIRQSLSEVGAALVPFLTAQLEQPGPERIAGKSETAVPVAAEVTA